MSERIAQAAGRYAPRHDTKRVRRHCHSTVELPESLAPVPFGQLHVFFRQHLDQAVNADLADFR